MDAGLTNAGLMNIEQRYALAQRVHGSHWERLVVGGRVSPQFLPGGRSFWWLDGTVFRLVDVSGTQREAFDHERLAKALDVETLPFRSIHLDGNNLLFEVDGRELVCDLMTYTVSPTGGPAVVPGELLSPDRRSVAFVRDHDLWVRDRFTGVETRLTEDGDADQPYGTPIDGNANRVHSDRFGLTVSLLALWSPDSRYLLSHRVDQRDVELVHLIESTPVDGSRPKAWSLRYAMVGDPQLCHAQVVVFDLQTGTTTWPDCEPFVLAYVSPFVSGQVWWGPSGVVRWVAPERADRVLRVRELDAHTGATSVLLKVTDPRRVQLSTGIFTPPALAVLGSGEVLFWSEDSGWGHLWLQDTSGARRQVTDGEWLVREVVTVDEDTRTAVITASGREEELDPYVRQVYRLHLDSGELIRLSDDALDHALVTSREGAAIVDTASAASAPPRVVLRDAAGEEVLHLTTADASALLAAGWQAPERFCLPGDDGTELWGWLLKPAAFDETASYPVLDEIYSGPQQLGFSPRFPTSRPYVPGDYAQPMAALGFVVVALDARGTPLRSRDFQEITRSDGLANLRDHIAVIRGLAATRPWMDLTRLGIYGHSEGGYAATKAMLHFPDVFSAAVSIAGGHDAKTYHAIWGEWFWGDLDVFDYAGHANDTHADRLEGPLMLLHGELDDNVPPSITLRVVDALMTAQKPFELVLVPGADHGMLKHEAYWTKRMWDFLVTQLTSEQPPSAPLAGLGR